MEFLEQSIYNFILMGVSSFRVYVSMFLKNAKIGARIFRSSLVDKSTSFPCDRPVDIATAQSRWPIFVINLENAKNRWNSVSRQLECLDLSFERLPAIDGTKLSRDEIAKVYDADRNRRICKAPMCPEEIGCYLSHIAAWQEVTRRNLPGAIILEDDFIAKSTLPGIIAKIETLPLDWDLIKLHCGPSIHGRQLLPMIGEHALYELDRVPIRTLGYAITAHAAARLCDRSGSFARPIDIDHKHWWEFGLSIRCVFPAVLTVDTQQLASSTIGAARRKQAALSTGLGRTIRTYRHFRAQIQYHIALRRFRRLSAREPLASRDDLSSRR